MCAPFSGTAHQNKLAKPTKSMTSTYYEIQFLHFLGTRVRFLMRRRFYAKLTSDIRLGEWRWMLYSTFQSWFISEWSTYNWHFLQHSIGISYFIYEKKINGFAKLIGSEQEINKTIRSQAHIQIDVTSLLILNIRMKNRDNTYTTLNADVYCMRSPSSI